MQLNRLTEMVVIADGKEEVRRISHLAEADSMVPRKVPVMQPGERVTYGVDGSAWIYRALK